MEERNFVDCVRFECTKHVQGDLRIFEMMIGGDVTSELACQRGLDMIRIPLGVPFEETMSLKWREIVEQGFYFGMELH